MVKIALDAYGGDNAPEEIVKGAMDCFEIADKGSIFIYFVGNTLRQLPIKSITR